MPPKCICILQWTCELNRKTLLRQVRYISAAKSSRKSFLFLHSSHPLRERNDPHTIQVRTGIAIKHSSGPSGGVGRHSREQVEVHYMYFVAIGFVVSADEVQNIHYKCMFSTENARFLETRCMFCTSFRENGCFPPNQVQVLHFVTLPHS